MLKGKIKGYLVTLLCGFLLGTLFILAIGFAEEKQQDIVEIVKPGVFGDIRIVKAKSDTWQEGGEVLMIFKDDYMFTLIGIDNSGKLTKCEIWDSIIDGHDRKLVEGWFENDKLSELWVYTNNEPGSLNIEASDKPGVWYKAVYARSSKAKKPIGEVYEDIDFDGQFDAKSIFDENTKVTSESIFINGEWLEVTHYDPNDLHASALYINGKFYKINLDDAESLKEATALPKSAKKMVHYDFEWGMGWKEREE